MVLLLLIYLARRIRHLRLDPGRRVHGDAPFACRKFYVWFRHDWNQWRIRGLIKAGHSKAEGLVPELTPWWIHGPIAAKFTTYEALKLHLTLEDLIRILEIWLSQSAHERLAQAERDLISNA